MSVIDPMTEGPTQRKILAVRERHQNSLLEEICDILGTEKLEIEKIINGKTTWQGNKLSQIITPEGKQALCLTESIMADILIRVQDIFVVGYSLEQTNRSSPGLLEGIIIQNISPTGESASGSSNRVWSRDSRGYYVADDTARPIDIEFKYRGMPLSRSVPDYTISPIHMIAQNPRFGQQGKIMD